MGKVSIAGGAVVGQSLDTVVVLTPGATPTLDTSLGSVFTLTPGEAENITATNLNNGDHITLVVTTSGGSSFTITFGTGFLTTGTLATGTVTAKVFVVQFVVQNGKLTEVSRTTAM